MQHQNRIGKDQIELQLDSKFVTRDLKSKLDSKITCAVVGPFQYLRQVPFVLQPRLRENGSPGMDPKLETVVSKLYAGAIEGGWQTLAAFHSNRHVATAIPLCVCVLPCCEQLGCKIAQCSVLKFFAIKYFQVLNLSQATLILQQQSYNIKTVNFSLLLSHIKENKK